VENFGGDLKLKLEQPTRLNGGDSQVYFLDTDKIATSQLNGSQVC